MRSWTRGAMLWAGLFTLAATAASREASGQSANTQIRVCPYGATGNPCTPLAQVYTDAGLTYPAGNPYSANPASNFVLYTAPGYYTVQVTGPSEPSAYTGQAVSGQVISASTGKPVAFASVRVCAYVSIGIPCSPLGSLYSDPGLTKPVANPYTTDQYGNYSVFTTSGYNIVQITVGPQTVYSYAKGYSGYASAAGSAGQIQIKGLDGALAGVALNGVVVGVSGAIPRVAMASDIAPLLTLFSTTAPGIVPASPGGTTTFLRADGTWVAPPSSGGVYTGYGLYDNTNTNFNALTFFSEGGVEGDGVAPLTLAMFRQALGGEAMENTTVIAQNVPPSAILQPNALSIWQRVLSNQTQAVGLYMQEIPGVDHAVIWNINPVCTDVDYDGTVHAYVTCRGDEQDINVNSPTTAGEFFFTGSAMNEQPIQLGVMQVPIPVFNGNCLVTSSVDPKCHYNYGIVFQDGAVGADAVRIGAQALYSSIKPSASDAGQLEFVSHNSAGGNYFGTLLFDNAGQWHMRGASTFINETGTILSTTYTNLGLGGTNQFWTTVKINPDPLVPATLEVAGATAVHAASFIGGVVMDTLFLGTTSAMGLYGARFDVAGETSAGFDGNLAVHAGTLIAPLLKPLVTYSGGGPMVPTCNAGSLGTVTIVSDATTPTYMTAYTPGGAVTASVICSYNGTAYNWLTH